MQCPFLIDSNLQFCETGAFGMMQVENRDFKKYCSGRTYYQCQVYRANTGTGNVDECLESISSRLVEV